MTESDLKRYLVKSIRAQGGVGQRYEDKYAVGIPDLVLIPEHGPVFFIEAKIITRARLVCTEIQGVQLKRFDRPRAYGRFYCLSAIIGYRNDLLYIGHKDQPLVNCHAVHRPDRLDSTEWPITPLLEMYFKHRNSPIDKHK